MILINQLVKLPQAPVRPAWLQLTDKSKSNHENTKQNFRAFGSLSRFRDCFAFLTGDSPGHCGFW